jgi:hypothetical protein
MITINEYGEYVYETPLVILAWPIMLFSTIFCLRLVARRARATDPSMKRRSSNDTRLTAEEKEFGWAKAPTCPSKSPITG